MSLRVSSEIEGEDVDLNSVVEGDAIDSGVPFGSELIQFTEAALGDDDELIRQTRELLIEKMGVAAMVDAAGVIAAFQRQVRIADGTGLPLEPIVNMMIDDVRGEMGLDALGSADNTPPLNFLQKLSARVIQPVIPSIIKLMSRYWNKR